MTPTSQETALRTWVRAVLGSGVEVIFSHQSGPRPDTPFATIRVLSETAQPFGNLEVIEDLEDDIGHLVHHYQGTVSVQVFGSNHRALMRQLVTAPDVPEHQLVAVNNGLSITAASPMTLDTYDLGVEWEHRSVCDFTYVFAEQIDTTTPGLEAVVSTHTI